MMNPWDKDAPWINSLRISKEAKQALWTQVQAGNITENEAESYNWGIFSDIANVVNTIRQSRVTGVPVNELQKAYTDLETIRTRIAKNDEEMGVFEKALTASRTDNVKVGKQTYSRERATQLLDRLRTNSKTLNDSFDKLRVRIMITRDDITAQKEFAEGFWKRYQATKNPEDFKRYQEATNKLSNLVVSSVNVSGPNVRVGVGRTGVVRQPDISTRTDAAGNTGFGASGITKPTGATGTGATGTGATGTGATVTKKPDEPKKQETPAADWESQVATEAGEYQYLLDPKYEGVPELLRRAVEQDWFATEEGKKTFLRELSNTPYGRNTNQKQQAFDTSSPGNKRRLIEAKIRDIQSEYGEIQLDQSALEEVATTAARNQSDAIELGRLVYRAAFKRGAAQPAFGESVAAKTALGGEDVARVRAIYRAYGQKADDQMIARILAGETDPASGVVMTEDMLRNNLRDIAKVSYRPFADLLDRGISVETIFQPYKNLAASVLDKTPDEVEFIDANGKPTQFASALMGKEPLSLTEWMTTLKADNKYGWQFTNEAKQKATNLVMDLEKAFGFRA